MAEGRHSAAPSAGSPPLLSVRDLSVTFETASGQTEAVRKVSFEVAQGERFAIVGESGSGKTVTALSVMRLNHDARYSGSIRLDDRELLDRPEREMSAIRGNDVGMIFQEPMSALDPLYTVGDQIAEALQRHQSMTRAQALRRATELLALTRVADPERRVHAYPHQLSGGQRQRAMIAMALGCNPRLLIADEPSTALDVTVQKQIMDLLRDLQKEFGMAVLLITHDLPLVRRFASRVAVMCEGEVVEQGSVEDVFAQPRHPYTRRLIESRPVRRVRPIEDPVALLQARAVRCSYVSRQGWFSRSRQMVVDGVDLSVAAGETLGVVGESGSGKTTLGLSLLRLSRADLQGQVSFDGQPIEGLSSNELRPLRARMQVVFQDPFSSLSPRMTVQQIIGEGLALHRPRMGREEREEAIVAVMREVGLDASMRSRYPHEFSGGQRQRVAIARAVVLEPDFIVLDEPTSALDVSVQRQVLDLLADLQSRRRLSYLFITHDLAVIRAMAHRVLVMKDGRVIEQGETQALFESPSEPYTRELLKASFD